MANSVRFTHGTSNVPPTAGRLVADTSGGTVNLILPSIAELQRFQQFGSGLNVAGTFNFSFEKIGNGQLVFQTSLEDETINGLSELVIDDIGSGIIFITSDLGWGITSYSRRIYTNHTERVVFTKTQYDNSTIISPIILIPSVANSLNVPDDIIIKVSDISDGVATVLTYGYIGNAPIGDIDISGAVIGDTIITPAIVSKLSYRLANNPVGLGVGFWKKSGSFGGNITVSNSQINISN